FNQWPPRPLRRANRPQIPLLAFDGRLEQRAAVTGALQGDDERLGRHVVEVTQAEAEGPLHEAANREPEGGRFEVWHVKVITEVEARVRHDDAADEGGNRRLAVERPL